METPDHVLSFGKHKGRSLQNVYLLEPSYINWLMLNHTSFHIDVSDFHELPTMAQSNDLQNAIIDFLIKDGMLYEDAVMYLFTKGELVIEKGFKFSKNALMTNESKRLREEKLQLQDELRQQAEEAGDYSRRYGYQGNVIKDAFEGDASATWNID